MQLDFHYYATYCAAYLAGYSHEESLAVCYSAQFVDCCTRTYLSGIGAPLSAATTQLQMEMMNADTDPVGLQDITRIWASFHFLPYDLRAEVRGRKRYRNKYRMICGPNGELLVETVKLAKGSSLQAAGIAMHILADTWAHRYFAGTPSLVINNTNDYFYEILPDEAGGGERPIKFRHNPTAPDDLEEGLYTASLYQSSESSIMNLGHGRAGHLPDYSFMRYRYLPAWGEYREIVKENPSDYLHAFTQMIEALKYLRGVKEDFAAERYDLDAIRPYEDRIRTILETRQLDSSADWKALGEELSGREIDAFDLKRYQQEYVNAAADGKDETFLGRFILAAMRQKSMVTNKIYTSGNRLAGVSVNYSQKGFRGIGDFALLVRHARTDAKGGEER